MPDKNLSNYFYGDEATQFTYFRIPCQLITHPRFKHLSTDSKLLYGMLSQNYEAEQKQLEAEVISPRQEIEVQERQNENIEKFIRKAHKYVGIETLDPYALRELVQAIYVEAPDKSSGKRRQSIHIKYDGMGFIPLDELMKRETA